MRFLWFLFAGLLFSESGFAFQKSSFNPNDTYYLWPSNASRLASASFAETRAAHFHAAIDIKTWGRVGFEMYATRDGILYRIARSPFGYGNVIYLKHDDGSFSLYAHLHRFNAQLDKLVDSLRWKQRVFVFDQNMESLNIRFKQGDLIGFSGESGAGPPHIHFEVRSPKESPVNPFIIKSLRVKDTVAPRFTALAVEPLDIQSKAEGSKRIHVRKARGVGRNYDFGTIDVKGQVGLAVDVFDQADGAANTLAVYELELKVGEEILFHSKADSFSYTSTRQMFLDRVYSILKRTNRGFQRLYRRDGNDLEFYKIAKPEAKLNLPEGLHAFTVTARDFYGNETKAFGKLNVTEPSSMAQKESFWYKKLDLPKISVFPERVKNWDWQNDWVRPEGEKNKETIVQMRSLDFFKPHERVIVENAREQAIDLRNHESVLFQINGSILPLHRIKPGVTTSVISTDQMVRVSFDTQAVYDTLSLAIGHIFNDTLGIETFYLLPEQEPLKRGFRVEMILPEYYRYPEKTSFYRYNQRAGRVDFAPSKVNGQRITANLRDFGVYHIKTDTIAPTLERPRIFRKPGNKWAASVKGKDQLSGIDYNKSRFWVNGEEGILEYDPDIDQIIYYHPDFKPKKKNELYLEVVDFVGNKLSKTFVVNY